MSNDTQRPYMHCAPESPESPDSPDSPHSPKPTGWINMNLLRVAGVASLAGGAVLVHSCNGSMLPCRVSRMSISSSNPSFRTAPCRGPSGRSCWEILILISYSIVFPFLLSVLQFYLFWPSLIVRLLLSSCVSVLRGLSQSFKDCADGACRNCSPEQHIQWDACQQE